jgi:hypothetical protein
MDTVYSVVLVAVILNAVGVTVLITCADVCTTGSANDDPGTKFAKTASSAWKLACESGGTQSDKPRFDVVDPGCGIACAPADPAPRFGI